MKRFGYFRPTTLREACELLHEQHEQAKILAGGTDLIVQLRMRKFTPAYVINIKDIPGLDYVRPGAGGEIEIGALATLRAIETNPAVVARQPVLSEAAREIGSVQIRNLATLAGNLCNAAPSADMAAPLLGLGCAVTLSGLQGERTMPIEEFFLGPGKTALQRGELLISVRVAASPPRTGCVYLKHAIRRAMDIAIVGVAARVTLNGGNRAQEVRIGLGAVAPVPLRARKAEELLRGQELTEPAIEEAAQIASTEARPITDIRGSAEYRTEMVRVLTRRALQAALQRATQA